MYGFNPVSGKSFTLKGREGAILSTNHTSELYENDLLDIWNYDSQFTIRFLSFFFFQSK
jgi:hypothetical protein